MLASRHGRANPVEVRINDLYEMQEEREMTGNISEESRERCVQLFAELGKKRTQPGIVYQFGPFEVNVASGELLKNGRRIKLTGATLSAPRRAPGKLRRSHQPGGAPNPPLA